MRVHQHRMTKQPQHTSGSTHVVSLADSEQIMSVNNHAEIVINLKYFHLFTLEDGGRKTVKERAAGNNALRTPKNTVL